MQQNTESLGSIFDAQPSQITGNIHSLVTPAEQVIGYVSAGTVQSQRIFIRRGQINSSYSYTCPIPDTLMIDASKYPQDFGAGPFTPIEFGQDKAGDKGWESNYTDCLVCTLRGGVNTPPAFWPN
jgi:hypothetical protein